MRCIGREGSHERVQHVRPGKGYESRHARRLAHRECQDMAIVTDHDEIYIHGMLFPFLVDCFWPLYSDWVMRRWSGTSLSCISSSFFSSIKHP